MGIHRRRRSDRLPARNPLALLDPLEPRRLFAATPLGSYPFGGSTTASVTDADGTTAQFSLRAGQGTVTVAEDGWHVALSKSTPAASLSITTAGGDGRVSLAGLTSATRLGSINAPKANLSGSISLTNVKSATLGSASDLSITSSTPVTTLSVASWSDTDASPDTLTAPSINSLTVKGDFAPALTLSSKKVALNAATIGGSVTGAWAVAGSAGKLKLHAVRTPDLSIAGDVKTLTLDDYVALSQVASATGGVLHLGGKGSVAAAKGQDKFQIANDTTLYTCTADMYTWADLYQYTHLDQRWNYTENGKATTSHVLPDTQTSDGHNMFLVQDTGHDPGTDSYYMDEQGRGHLLSSHDDSGTYQYSDLLISPDVYRLGVATRSTSKGSGSSSDDGVSIHFSGPINYATHLAGHALVKTPAGTFLTARVVSSISGNLSGSATDGVHSAGIKMSMSGFNTEYIIPGYGVVKADDTGTARLEVPSFNHSETQKIGDHKILASGNHVPPAA